MDFRRSFRWEPRNNKPLMLLKDYPLDDLSSCSSSGFKSLPRRPSFSSSSFSLSASVRLLIDADLRSAVPPTKNGLSRSSSTALFRSGAVKLINAMKSPLRTTCFLLRGGQAGKYLKNEAAEDIGQWSSYYGEESIKWGRDFAASIPSHGGDFSGGNWDYGKFVAETSGFCSENGFMSDGTDAVVMGGEIVNGTDGENHIGGKSTGPSSKEWIKDKEKFSPLSVLDCPFQDDEEAVDSQSKSSPANVGTRKGNHRRDGLSRLALVQLERIIASPELEEEKTTHLDKLISSPSKTACLIEEDNTEAILERMLETVRAADIPSYDSKLDILLRDFFREKLTEWEEYQYAGVFCGRNTFEDKAMCTAEDWARRELRGAYSGWEIEGGRMVYIKDMESGGEGAFERYEVCLEVDNVVWTWLVYEALIDIF